MSTEEYKKKRDFKKTPEPLATPKKVQSNIFVVQKHDARSLHYDLRLGSGGVLKSWAVPKGPSMNPEDKRLAVMVEDHPYDYKDFEGTIPQGNYGAGTVIIWDKGNFTTLQGKSVEDGINMGHFSFVLNGEKLKGVFSLLKIKGKENDWLLIKKNEYANNETLPKPMLASITDKPFDDPDFVFEIKWDGYRTLAKKEGEKVLLYSRNQNSFNKRYPEIVHSLEKLNHDFIIDGELVASDSHGHPSFQALQHTTGLTNLIYYIFDILSLDGKSLLDLTLEERRRHLKQLPFDGIHLKISDYVEEKGNVLFNFVKENNLEGIMAKRKDSIYKPGIRSKDWLKIKSLLRDDFVICGFTEGRSGGSLFGALILGRYEGNELKYAGHVGTGFDERTSKELFEIMVPLVQHESPFSKKIKTNMPVTWLKPEKIAEIEYKEVTEEGSLRQPVFLGLRRDITGEDIRVEEQKERAVVTNPDKIYWPDEGYTKGDLINYYKQMAEYILPHVKNRPISLHRYPEGIGGERFYHKNIGKLAPEWIQTVVIPSNREEKGETEYMLIDDIDSLIYAVNLGSIEINPWLSRIDTPDNPDFLVIDLDPHDIDFKYVVKTAQALKEVLDALNIFSLPKTSGKKGMHIFIPIEPKYSYEEIKILGEIIANMVHEKTKDFTSVERMSKKRSGKVYLDYLQNSKGQTIASVYSIRPVEGATVSTPLKWEEVNEKLDPKSFTIKTVPDRVQKIGDIFKPILENKNDIKRIIKTLE